jgi:hypothetical protein
VQRRRSLARNGLKISSASSDGAALHARAWLLGSVMYVLHSSPSIFCHSTPGASATFAAAAATAFLEAGNELRRSASPQTISQFFAPYDTAVTHCLYSVPHSDYVPSCRSAPINCARFDRRAYQLVLVPLAWSHQSVVNPTPNSLETGLLTIDSKLPF